MKLVLKCLNDSFKFETKKLSLANQIIIGRQVDGSCCKENGMFECRVLSKNHAIIWAGNNKVYIKDTNSSNGTFINDRRINHENDNQPAYEITRSTVLQFGVSVTTPDGVFHPCVICRVDIEDDIHTGDVSLLGELDSLVGQIIVGHDNVDRQLELFESNLAIWEDALTFNLQGKLQVNDLVSRISFLHDKLSLMSPKTLTSLDEETFMTMTANRDTLYRAELESALKEKDDLLTILAENEEKTIDCLKRVEFSNQMNDDYKSECALNAMRIDNLIEEKDELTIQLNDSENEIHHLNSIIQDYKSRQDNSDESDNMPGIDVKFETMDDLSVLNQDDSCVHQLRLELEEERSNSALLSDQVTELEESISMLNARIAQLSTLPLNVQTHDLSVQACVEDGTHSKTVGNKIVGSFQWNYQILSILLFILFILVILFNVYF